MKIQIVEVKGCYRRRTSLIRDVKCFNCISLLQHAQNFGLVDCHLGIGRYHIFQLERQSLASSSDNCVLHASRSNKVIAVGNRSESSLLRGVLTISEIVVVGHRIAIVSRVEGLLASRESVGLDEKLGTLASVDSIADVQEVAVVDVASAKAERRCTRVDVVPVVVVLGDVQISSILITIAVRVSNQRCFPVVMDESVRHGNVVSGVCKLYNRNVSIVSKGSRLRKIELLTSIRPS